VDSDAKEFGHERAADRKTISANRSLTLPALATVGPASAEKCAPVLGASTCIHDCGDPPPITLESAGDTLRLYVPQTALREVVEDTGADRSGRLRTTPDGTDDRRAFNRIGCLLPIFETAETTESILVDQIALAFMTHLLRTYSADAPVRALPTGGLAPWQARRAKEALAASAHHELSIATSPRWSASRPRISRGPSRRPPAVPRIGG
jgi:hypothetical protein